MSETKKTSKNKVKFTIKTFYLSILLPVIIIGTLLFTSGIIYAYFYPNYIYFIKNQDKLEKIDQELSETRIKRINSLNNEIDKLDKTYFETENMNYDKYIQLRITLENERNSLWEIKWLSGIT